MKYNSGLIFLILSFSLLYAQNNVNLPVNSLQEQIHKNIFPGIQTQQLTLQIESEKYNIGEVFVNDFSDALNTGINIAAAPFHFSTNDWLTTGIVAGGTILLFTIDDNVKDMNLSNQTATNDNIFMFDNYMGNGYTALFTAGVYGYGLLSGNNDIRKLGLQASEAFIYSGIIETIFKAGFGRQRPYKSSTQFFFEPFEITDNGDQSFPSGHTTVSFAVATVMADYSQNFFWKLFWYGSAGMVGLSRIYHNQHWASDVFLGAALGYFTAKFILNSHSETKTNSPGMSVSFSPVFSVQGNGVGMNIRF